MFTNLNPAQLIQHALRSDKNAKLSSNGALVVYTGKFTGRAANDKYVVETQESKNKVAWGKDLKKMDPSDFAALKIEVLSYLESMPAIYKSIKSVGANEKYSLDVELVTPSASHALFAHYLFREKVSAKSLDRFTIYHAPELEVNPEKYNTKSGTVIVTNFDEKTILILGTRYAGEIKKSIFSVMNYILPDNNILPVHAGASIINDGTVSVFFGLSGTGKTTLSTDQGSLLIGDDEHGISQDEIFNFEGGCYAKTLGLNKESEPEIYSALTRFGSLLENVELNPEDNSVDFSSSKFSQNGRGSYPLSFIDELVPNSKAAAPSHFFFLSADAFGVLPPVSLLTKEQAMYYFLSGYTAKVAGTEMGVTEPVAAFSMCFGAPFMLRHPDVYANLLGDFLQKNKSCIWLINTGWTGGKAGVGSRFPLKVTREIIRSIQQGRLAPSNTKFNEDPIFGLHVPEKVDNVPSELLNPVQTWSNKDTFKETAQELAKMFHSNFSKFSNVSEAVKNGAPIYGRS